MFNHIKLKPNKVLPETSLLNLGRINVFCGKNSSGKTTILETINDLSKIIIGLTFEYDETQKLYKSYTGLKLKANYTGNVPSGEFYREIFEKSINELLKNKNIYFEDNSDDFFQILSIIFEKKLALSGYELQPKKIIEDFKGIFESAVKEFSKALLPPKRSLSSIEEIKFSKPVETTGQWISNKLFFAKTQPTGSKKNITFKKIGDVFTEITSGFNFDVFSDFEPNVIGSENYVKLKFKHQTQSKWIEASDCGLGLRDLLTILYFATNPEIQLLLIEEPENHIHPEIQRKLLKFLSEQTDKQYFITTHSNIFLNTTYTNRIFFTSYENGQIKVSDATKRTEILNELGYSVSDNLVSDLIILVEGPKDTPVIEEFIKKFGYDADYNIKTWALGGDIMDQVDLSVFSERYKVLALIDNDPGSKIIRKRFIQKCKELEIPVTRLSRYAIENYFSVRALREVFKAQIPQKFAAIDPDKTLQDQIKINVKNNNRKLARETTLDEIKGTDFYRFFDKVRAKLKE